MAQSSNLLSLYSDLVRHGQSGDYDRALKIVNKILQESPDDHKAYQCKVICQIHLSEFENALKTIAKHASEMLFEKGYCLYRLNRVKEALAALQKIPIPNYKVKELLAQVLYRLEKYEECFDTYRDLIKNSEDEYEDERETNLAAVCASLSAEDTKQVKNLPQLREHTYELCYNSACILIGQRNFSAAIAKLKNAEELCKQTLEEEDVPEEDIEAELGVIRAQLGYALQMKSKTEQALKLYNQVLKQKPIDSALAAVASNNIVTINKDQNVFDSKKKIKTATADGLDAKLNSGQLKVIAVNQCLLLLYTNQAEQCRRQLQMLLKKYPESATEVVLVQAALLCKEKQITKAVDVLKEFADSHPDHSVAISFTLVQLLLSQGHISQACIILRSLGDMSFRPGIVSALVTLYLYLEDRESASGILKEAVDWYRKNNASSPELGVLVRESSRIHLNSGQAVEAAKLLEELRRSSPQDPKTLAQLISAYSQFDPKKAKEISKELPPVKDVSKTIDVDSLEATSWTMGAKYVKKAVKVESSPAGAGDGLIQKRRRKKKKGKLPKNYDSHIDPDPERWLPKRERSTYKKRKDRRGGGTGIGKGTQGAIGSVAEIDTSKAAVSPRPGANNTPSPAGSGPSTTQASPNPQGPRQQRPQAVQKKKRKKGGRW